MRSDLYREMYELEESYWWHIAKRRLVRKFLTGRFRDFSKLKIVDVGCGTGKLLEEMSGWKKWKSVAGLDGSNEALSFCRKRGIKNVKKADFEKKLPLKSSSVDVATSLDVVEHIKGDEKLLGEIERVLKPGGVVIITVPAYKWLWTYWDDILGHKKRYTKRELERMLRACGLEVERISYFYSYLVPVAVFFRLIKSQSSKLKGSSDFVKLPGIVNKLLLFLSGFESSLINKISLPMGLSIVCVARKK